MNSSKTSPRTHGFTLLELMIVVAIIAILISILLPSLARARDHAHQVKCAANLRGIGMGIFYYVNDPLNGNGFLPSLSERRTPAGDPLYWAEQIMPYVTIKRSKVGTRYGLLVCSADPTPVYTYINGPFAGSRSTEQEKLLADSGGAPNPLGMPSGGVTRRRGSKGGGTVVSQPTRAIGPLIEPVSYSGADKFIHDYSGQQFTKLTGLDRPHCQTLMGEVNNSCCGPPAFEWAHYNHGFDGLEGRQARRHYGGMNPNRNGPNWLFADMHIKWQTMASLPGLFCCQDFNMNPHVRDAHQKPKCRGLQTEVVRKGTPGRRSG